MSKPEFSRHSIVIRRRIRQPSCKLGLRKEILFAAHVSGHSINIDVLVQILALLLALHVPYVEKASLTAHHKAFQ
jgi:hypothetical protein